MSTPRPVAPRTQRRPSRRRHSAERQSQELSGYLPRLARACLIAALLSALFCGVASLPGALLLSSLHAPDAALPGVSVAILLAGVLLGSMYVGLRTGDRTLLGGIVFGTLLLVIMLPLSLPLAHATCVFLPAHAHLLRAAVVLFAVLGVYLGGHLPARRPGKRR